MTDHTSAEQVKEREKVQNAARLLEDLGEVDSAYAVRLMLANICANEFAAPTPSTPGPVAIYQTKHVGASTWIDGSEHTYTLRLAYPQDWDTRIVYSASSARRRYEHWLRRSAVHRLRPHEAATPPPQPKVGDMLTRAQWYDIASKYALRDWTNDYVTLIKAVCADFAALASSPTQPGIACGHGNVVCSYPCIGKARGHCK